MKKITSLFLTLCLLLGLTACGGSDAPKPSKTAETTSAVSFVLGHTEVFPKVSLSSASDRLYETFYNYGNVSAIVADGQPQLDASYTPKRPNSTTAGKRAQTAEKQVGSALSAMNKLVADTPESDLLAAITMGARQLKASGAEQQSLIIYASGLPTTGVLNFAASNLLDADPQWLLSELQSRHSIPDLSGIDVEFYGLGTTAGHQSPPDEENKYKLQAIWSAILSAGNPASLEIDMRPLTGTAPAEGLPTCSAVPIVNKTLTAEAPLSEDTVVRFDEIYFLSNSAEFVDRSAAERIVEPVAHQLLSSEDRIILAGSIASTGSGDGISLSEARSEAVKTLFLEEGIAAENIRCVGLGKRPWSLRVVDLDAEGNLIEAQAQFNRAVYLFLESSPYAAELGIS